MNTTTRMLAGFGNVTTKPNGILRVELSPNDDIYEAELFIVPSHAMASHVILGRDFLLTHTEVTIRKGRIEIKPMNDTAVQRQEFSERMDQVDVAEHEDLLSIDCIITDEIDVAEPYKSKIEAMIAEYHPREDVPTL